MHLEEDIRALEYEIQRAMMYLKATDEMLGSTRRLIESSSQVLKCYG
jgi:hypothetical protein